MEPWGGWLFLQFAGWRVTKTKVLCEIVKSEIIMWSNSLSQTDCLQLENKIWEQAPLCFIPMLFGHTFYLYPKLQLLQFGNCTWPYCYFSNILMNCAPLICNRPKPGESAFGDLLWYLSPPPQFFLWKTGRVSDTALAMLILIWDSPQFLSRLDYFNNYWI